MPRDVSGTYTAPSNSFNPAVDGTDIEPADWNAILLDLVAQGLNVIPASLISGDLQLANFNSGTGASSTTFWRGDRTWQPVVTGPNTSDDNAAARFDATTGKIIQNSPLIIADTTGSLSRTGNGGIPLQGTNTNDSAASGFVGEFITASVLQGSAVNVPSATVTNITSVALTAGDWDLTGGGFFIPAASTSINRLGASIETTNVGFTPLATNSWVMFMAPVVPAANPVGHALPVLRVSLTTPTTYYLNVLTSFTVSTLAGFGTLRARRVR